MTLVWAGWVCVTGLGMSTVRQRSRAIRNFLFAMCGRHKETHSHSLTHSSLNPLQCSFHGLSMFSYRVYLRLLLPSTVIIATLPYYILCGPLMPQVRSSLPVDRQLRRRAELQVFLRLCVMGQCSGAVSTITTLPTSQSPPSYSFPFRSSAGSIGSVPSLPMQS